MSTLLCIKWNGGTEPSAAWLGRHLSSHATRAHSSHPYHSSLSRDKTASNPSGRRGQVLVNYQSSAHPFSRPHTKLPIHPFFICLFTHASNYIPNYHSSDHVSLCLSIHPSTYHSSALWCSQCRTQHPTRVHGRNEENGIYAYPISSSQYAPCIGERGEREPVSPCYVLI